MKKYQHIVFDIDGTLIDTREANLKALQIALKKSCNQYFHLEQLDFVNGLPGEIALNALYISNKEEVTFYWNKYYNIYSKQSKCFNNIFSVLRKLNEYYVLGIVTSRSKKDVYYDSKLNKLLPLFKTIVCREDTIFHKPSDDPIKKYLQLSELSNYNMLYVGDTIYDYSSCAKSNVDFALAKWGYVGSSESDGINATFYLEKPECLLTVLLD